MSNLKRLKLKEVNASEFYAFMDHLMKSKGGCCFAPAKRYCIDGLRLKKEYEESEQAKRS